MMGNGMNERHDFKLIDSGKEEKNAEGSKRKIWKGERKKEKERKKKERRRTREWERNKKLVSVPSH